MSRSMQEKKKQSPVPLGGKRSAGSGPLIGRYSNSSQFSSPSISSKTSSNSSTSKPDSAFGKLEKRYNAATNDEERSKIREEALLLVDAYKAGIEEAMADVAAHPICERDSPPGDSARVIRIYSDASKVRDRAGLGVAIYVRDDLGPPNELMATSGTVFKQGRDTEKEDGTLPVEDDYKEDGREWHLWRTHTEAVKSNESNDVLELRAVLLSLVVACHIEQTLRSRSYPHSPRLYFYIYTDNKNTVLALLLSRIQQRLEQLPMLEQYAGSKSLGKELTAHVSWSEALVLEIKEVAQQLENGVSIAWCKAQSKEGAHAEGNGAADFFSIHGSGKVEMVPSNPSSLELAPSPLAPSSPVAPVEFNSRYTLAEDSDLSLDDMTLTRHMVYVSAAHEENSGRTGFAAVVDKSGQDWEAATTTHVYHPRPILLGAEALACGMRLAGLLEARSSSMLQFIFHTCSWEAFNFITQRKKDDTPAEEAEMYNLLGVLGESLKLGARIHYTPSHWGNHKQWSEKVKSLALGSIGQASWKSRTSISTSPTPVISSSSASKFPKYPTITPPLPKMPCYKLREYIFPLKVFLPSADTLKAEEFSVGSTPSVARALVSMQERMTVLILDDEDYHHLADRRMNVLFPEAEADSAGEEEERMRAWLVASSTPTRNGVVAQTPPTPLHSNSQLSTPQSYPHSYVGEGDSHTLTPSSGRFTSLASPAPGSDASTLVGFDNSRECANTSLSGAGEGSGTDHSPTTPDEEERE